MKRNKIGVLGLWHLGSVYASCLAKLGFEVTGYDENPEIVKTLAENKPSIQEPFLEEAIKEFQKTNLQFSNEPSKAIYNKAYVFVTYDVPVDDSDNIDLSVVDRSLTLLSKYISPFTTVVVSSQVPVGYCRSAGEKLKRIQPTVNIIYFPENLRLGTAFEGFLNPDRIVIGTDNNEVAKEFEKDFSTLKCPFVKMSLESAEMVKHALNSYLALTVSFSSELGDLSEILGADMNDVVKALKTDKRVSPHAPISPGLGFAGGTLGRDVQTLRRLAKKNKYKSLLLDSVYQVNQNRLTFLVSKLRQILSSLKGKHIGILGLTYKPKTNILRRSMSLELAKLLKKEGSAVKAFDPTAKEAIKDLSFIKVAKTLPDLFKNLDLAILMTEWEDFKEINWKEIKKLMRTNLIFDSKNFLDKKSLEQFGFKYFGIGFKS